MKRNQFIYADNAATTKLSTEAFEAMIPWLTDEYGNASQPYSFARKPKKALADARAIIAKCINTSPEEIYFTSGGTESNNWAIKGSAYSADYKSLIITSAIEHHSILNACASIEKHGFPIKYLVPDQYGIIFPEKLESTITNNTRLVSVMFSNNEIGTIEPIKQLVEVAHRCGALFHTDAVNAIGHTKIDVQDLGVDMLSASAHKFNGPKGIGFLYIKKGTNIIPYCDGGSQEFGMRAGTENIASIVGMATALKINVEQLQQNEKYMLTLEERLLKELQCSGLDYKHNGHRHHIPGLVSVSFKNGDGETILHRLDLMGICISTGSACDSVNTKISHVLQAIKLSKDYAKGTVRISLGKENTENDVVEIVNALKKVLQHQKVNT